MEPAAAGDARPGSTRWVVVGTVTLILLTVALLNLARVVLIGEPATLPEHLAPWATRASSYAELIREEASLRLANDPRYRDARNELGSAEAEARLLPTLIQELEGEVELIRRIDARANALADAGAGPSVEAQQRALAALVEDARRGVLIDDERLDAALEGHLPAPTLAPAQDAPAPASPETPPPESR